MAEEVANPHASIFTFRSVGGRSGAARRDLGAVRSNGFGDAGAIAVGQRAVLIVECIAGVDDMLTVLVQQQQRRHHRNLTKAQQQEKTRGRRAKVFCPSRSSLVRLVR